MRRGYAKRLCEEVMRRGYANGLLENFFQRIISDQIILHWPISTELSCTPRRMYPLNVSRAGSLYGFIKIYSYREMSGISGNEWDIDK